MAQRFSTVASNAIVQDRFSLQAFFFCFFFSRKRAYREKRACNAILSVKTSKSLLLLRIALSVINYCYGILRVNGN